MPSATGSRGQRRARLQQLEPEIRLSVVGRVAYLDGSVSCYDRKKALAQLAGGLPFVDSVVNRLRVVPGSLRPDRAIEEAVLAALTIDPVLRLENVSVKVADGVVELSGVVADISARISAEAAAWSACGVCHVDNRLEIASRSRPAPEQLGRELHDGLRRALGPWAEWVDLQYHRGVVRLRGDVPSAEDRLAAEDWVRWHPLVRSVVNELSVQQAPLSSLGKSA